MLRDFPRGLKSLFERKRKLCLDKLGAKKRRNISFVVTGIIDSRYLRDALDSGYRDLSVRPSVSLDSSIRASFAVFPLTSREK